MAITRAFRGVARLWRVGIVGGDGLNFWRRMRKNRMGILHNILWSRGVYSARGDESGDGELFRSSQRP